MSSHARELHAAKHKEGANKSSVMEKYTRGKLLGAGSNLVTTDVNWAEEGISAAIRFLLRRKGQLRGSISRRCKGGWLKICVEGDQFARSF